MTGSLKYLSSKHFLFMFFRLKKKTIRRKNVRKSSFLINEVRIILVDIFDIFDIKEMCVYACGGNM